MYSIRTTILGTIGLLSAAGCFDTEDRGASVEAAATVSSFCGDDSGLADSPWPTQGRCQSRQGRGIALGPDAFEETWRASIGPAKRTEPALDEDGTIYVGGRSLFSFTHEGEEKWHLDVGARINAPTVARNGLIYVTSVNGELMAVNREGELVHSASTHREPSPSLAVDGSGNVYVTSRHGRLYAFTPDLEPRFAVHVKAHKGSSPTIGSDGSILVVRADKHLAAYSPMDGTERWATKLESQSWSTPVVGSWGTVYLGASRGWVHAMDGATGRMLWSEHLRLSCDSDDEESEGDEGSEGDEQRQGHCADVEARIAIDARGNVIVAQAGGTVRSLSDHGEGAIERWVRSLGERVTASPIVDIDSRIFLGGADGSIFAIDAETGEPLWAGPGSAGPTGGVAMNDDGTLLVAGGSWLRSIGAPRIAVTESWASSELGAVGYFGFSLGDDGGGFLRAGNGFYGIDDKGTVVHEVTAATRPPTSVRALPDGAGYTTQQSSVFRVYDRRGGELLRLELAPNEVAFGTFDEGALVVLVMTTQWRGPDEMRVLSTRFISANGSGLGVASTPGLVSASVGGGHLIYSTQDELIRVRYDGAESWRLPLSARKLRMARAADAVIASRSQHPAELVFLTNGLETARHDCGDHVWNVSISPNGAFAAATTRNEIFVFQRGALLFSRPMPLEWAANLAIDDEGLSLVGGQDADHTAHAILYSRGGTVLWQERYEIDDHALRPDVGFSQSGRRAFVRTRQALRTFEVSR